LSGGLIILRINGIDLNLINAGVNIDINVKITGIVGSGKITFRRGGDDQGTLGGGGTLDGDLGIGDQGFVFGGVNGDLVIVGA